MGSETSARRPLTWRFGARRAELAAAVARAAERSTKPGPSSAGAEGRWEGEAEAEGTPPAPRPRARRALDAMQGARALCLGASGAPLA